MERKIFWLSFFILSLIADFTLPLLWAVLATLPIAALSWWMADRNQPAQFRYAQSQIQIATIFFIWREPRPADSAQ